MHMADALLSPAVGGAMFAVSSGLVLYSIREVHRHFDESRVPLMGAAGAFVFAGQMINFAIPGTGSSGHIAGAVLLTSLLGPSPAFLIMASVLLVQALFFADGGLLALGANLFNMGFFGCFLAYPLLFRPLMGRQDGKEISAGRLTFASCAACIVGLELGALAVTIETLASGVTELPFWTFAAAMLPIHLAIGLGEGLATAAVLIFVRKNLPDFTSARLAGAESSVWRHCAVLGLGALVLGGGLSLIASEHPDGLEWSMERVAGTSELLPPGAGITETAGITEAATTGPSGIYAVTENLSESLAFLPDYAFPGSESFWGTTVSGIVGVLLCAAILVTMGFLACRFRRCEEPAKR